MKATLAVLLLTATTVSTYAGQPEAQRYLVATREKPELVSGRVARTGADVVDFTTVRGFAATLTADEAEKLASDPDVRFVELDPKRYLDTDRDAVSFVRRTTPVSSAESEAQLLPYGIQHVQAPQLWSFGRGAGIRVGVVDTGIDSRHPDLAANLKGGQAFVGVNLSALQDGVGHGSHVAGTIAAIDNAQGVVGVAPQAEIYSLRVFDDNGEFTTAGALISVIDFAIANHIRVLNMSLGGPENSQMEREAFDKAVQNGVLVFASSGNDGRRVIAAYPAAYDGAIAIGAIDETRTIASFSTFGPYLKLVAPGVSVLSTFPIDAGVLPLISGNDIHPIAASLMTNSPTGQVSGPFVFCELGKQGEFPPGVSGKIALIKRGEITFAEKAKNAKAAGASGVIIFNNVDGGFNGTLGDEPFAWPVTVAISLAQGEEILGAAGTQLSLDFRQGYEFLQGTSMACPHVVGVAALIWSLRPEATAAEVRDALLKTAIDLGPVGWDEKYGFGAVNAFAAARQLAPALFPRSRGARR